MGLFKTGDYNEALKYFAKAKVIRTPVYEVANKYFTLLKQWDEQQRKLMAIDQSLVILRATRPMRQRVPARSSASIAHVSG